MTGPTIRLRLLGPRRPLETAGATHLVTALGALACPVLLEVCASEGVTEIAVRIAAEHRLRLERALLAAAPDAKLEPSDWPAPSPSDACLFASFHRPRGSIWLPLRDVRSCVQGDPLGALVEAVQPMAANEFAHLGFAIHPLTVRDRQRAQRYLNRLTPSTDRRDLVSRLLLGQPREPRFPGSMQRRLQERLQGPLFRVHAGLLLSGANLARLQSKVPSVQSVFAAWLDDGFGGLSLQVWPSRGGGAIPKRLIMPVHLTAAELAALWHLPSDQLRAPGIQYLSRPLSPLPEAAARAGGLVLGVHHHRGKEVLVHLPRADFDAGHFAAMGRTGTGKTTLIHAVCRQLIAQPDRPGLGVIDPHGDLVRDIAARSIPPTRFDDTVFLDLGDADFPIALPLFSAPPHVPIEHLIQTAFSLFRLIFRDHWSQTRMEDAIYALTATLCYQGDASLLDAPALFDNPIFRRRALARVSDPQVKQFWANYERLSESARLELVRPIMYRLRSLMRTPAVRNLLCQRRGIDLAALTDQGKIILVSLAGQAIAAEADLLGELVIARLHLGALARLEREPTKRRPFYLVVDESQRFQGTSLPVLLSEGRKLGVPLLLATQYLDGWGDSLRSSVLGNVGTLVAFRSSVADSKRLAPTLRPFDPEHLEDLSRFEAVIKYQIDGETMPAFDVRTLPVGKADEHSRANVDALRAVSRAHYARPRRQVEEQLGQAQASPFATPQTGDVDEE